MLSIFEQYKNLILQTTLSITLTLFLTFLNIPVIFLQGINTYIHPDNLPHKNNNNNSGPKAAIRRPNSDNNEQPKQRRPNKSKFEFDENNAQIFRIKLDQGHLQTRLYFNDYRYSFIYSFLGFSSLLLYKVILGDIGNFYNASVLGNGSLIPIVLLFVAFSKSFSSLARAAFEISASKRSEKQLSGVFGFLGFVFGLVLLSGAVSSVIDFEFPPINGGLGVFVATFMGCIAGFLYIPAGKVARSLWLGTDQIRCNLDIISCGWFARMILYANYLLNVLTALLWINPLSEFFVYNKESKAVGDQLVGKIGLSPENFRNFRIWCLLLSGVTQIMALRPNLQIYLNEAVLSWYQRLHAGKVPDLDYSRAKVFLHNHYLCLAALQFFTPPSLLLLLLGLSYIDGNSLKGFVFPFAVFRELALCMAWWIVFVWSTFTSTNLMLYRLGVFYVS
ncbi:hypothetical protein ACFE04_006046 [Oxalis oulophora]